MAEAITLGGGKAVVLSEGGRLEQELAGAGGQFIRFAAKSKNPATILFNAARLTGLLSSLGVSLVHARSRAPAWSVYLSKSRRRRPFVTTYHGIYNQKGPLKAYYNSVMARSDAVICNSMYTADIVAQRHPLARDRIEVIYRGVDLARFDAARVSEDRVRDVREAWGAKPDARLVLLPARLTRWKGHETLIEAAAALSAMPGLGPLEFVFAGDEQGRAGYREELHTLVERHGLTGRVIFGGHWADMPAAFAAAAVTVVPSIEPEAFGRVSIEAQAMGCPVIVSNIGALPETLVPYHEAAAGHPLDGGKYRPDARTASLFEPGDAQGLRAAVAAVLSNSPEVLAARAAEARDWVRSQFSKTALQFKTLEVYDRLLGTQLAQTFRASSEKS